MNRDPPQRNQLNDDVGSFITPRITKDNFRSAAGIASTTERASASYRNHKHLNIPNFNNTTCTRIAVLVSTDKKVALVLQLDAVGHLDGDYT